MYRFTVSLESGVSSARQDIENEILHVVFRMNNIAHVGVKENEVNDKLVKEALKHHDIDIRVKQKSRR